MQKRVLSLLVDNTAGVTTRVSGLFSRRGYNIDSITGGVTADERFSRITVVCSGDELILEQITNQLAKLVDVRDIKILEPDNSVCHELMMIKVAAKPEQRQGLISIADVFHAKVADVSVDSMILEMTGNHNKLEAFLDRGGGLRRFRPASGAHPEPGHPVFRLSAAGAGGAPGAFLAAGSPGRRKSPLAADPPGLLWLPYGGTGCAAGAGGLYH